MLDKFHRSFSIKVVDLMSFDVITIEPPFTVEFSINRAFWGSPNSAKIKIYNLSEKTRSFLRKDQDDYGNKKALTFSAGYGGNLSTLTRGNIQQCNSYRQGVNYITEIDILDGGAAFLNSSFSGQFVSETNIGDVIKAIAKSMGDNDVQMGAFSRTFDQNIMKRGSSYSGTPTDILNELTGGCFFIDNSIVNVIKPNEFIKGDSLIVNSQTGLIGVPKREWVNTSFEMILEPRFYIGQKIKIDIKSKVFDGDYVVRSIAHTGTISEAVGGKLTTSITCTSEENMVGVSKNG